MFAAAGVRFDLAEPPWWALEVLHWLAMIRALQQAYGKAGPAYRSLVADVLRGKPYPPAPNAPNRKYGPRAIKALFEEYAAALDAEQRRAG